MKTDFITLFKLQSDHNAYFVKLFQVSNGERRTTDIVYSEDENELYHVDNDRTKFKSNIRVLSVKNLEVKRVLCKNVVFTNCLYLNYHPHLLCGGFGTSNFRVLDPETGVTLKNLKTVNSQYIESCVIKFGSMMIAGGNDSIGFTDEDSEQLIAQFKCDGNVKQICVSPNGKNLIFVADSKTGANVYKINIQKQSIKEEPIFSNVTAIVMFADNLFFHGDSHGKLYLANLIQDHAKELCNFGKKIIFLELAMSAQVIFAVLEEEKGGKSLYQYSLRENKKTEVLKIKSGWILRPRICLRKNL